jgi:transient receptor potential cation channel subfamily C member 4
MLTMCFQRKNREKAQRRHDAVMRLLIRRFVTSEQRRRDDFGITEDDILEVRQDISSMRFELIDILGKSGMKVEENQKGGDCKYQVILNDMVT